MPRPDRRKLRQQLADQRGASREKRLVGFDFDCTLTTRHFFKCFAWCYAQSNPDGHAHGEAFYQWCDDHGIDAEEHRVLQREADGMSSAVDHFCRVAGEDVFAKLVREFFLGGEERIKVVAKWLEAMAALGVEFAIVTAGVSTAVLRALNAVPEWQKFFPSSRIWDTSQSRHSVKSTMATKAMICRDVCSDSINTILVDDSLGHDPPPEWALKGAQVEVMGLEYEGSGVDKAYLEDIQKRLGLAEVKTKK